MALVANATALVLMVGLIFLVAAVLRLEFITQFISAPVMAGFVTGLAVFVAVGQLNKLFGVEKPDGNTVEKFVGIVRELPEANIAAPSSASPRWCCCSSCLASAAGSQPGWSCCSARSPSASSTSRPVRGGDRRSSSRRDSRGPIARTATVNWLDLPLPAIAIFFVAYSEALGVAREFADTTTTGSTRTRS